MTNTRGRSWVAPLLAGSFCAFGYGITERILILQGDWQKPRSQLFQNDLPFPGEKLKGILPNHKLNAEPHNVELAEKKPKEFDSVGGKEKLKPDFSTRAKIKEKRLMPPIKTIKDATNSTTNSNKHNPKAKKSKIGTPSSNNSAWNGIFSQKILDELFNSLPQP